MHHKAFDEHRKDYLKFAGLKACLQNLQSKREGL